jgi:hypothetical protein
MGLFLQTVINPNMPKAESSRLITPGSGVGIVPPLLTTATEPPVSELAISFPLESSRKTFPRFKELVPTPVPVKSN